MDLQHGCSGLPPRPSGPSKPAALGPGCRSPARTLPAAGAFRGDRFPSPLPGPPPLPYRLLTALGGCAPVPVPSSPVSRCPGYGPVLRAPGAPAAESGRRCAAEPGQSESSVLAASWRAGGPRAEGVKPGASPYLQKVKNVWSLHLLKGRCWLQGVLAPAARKAGQGREFPSTSTKTLQKKAERPTL